MVAADEPLGARAYRRCSYEKVPDNPIRALRAVWFALIVAIAAIAIADSALAVVLAIIIVGLPILIVPLVAIYYDEHPDRLGRHRPGSA